MDETPFDSPQLQRRLSWLWGSIVVNVIAVASVFVGLAVMVSRVKETGPRDLRLTWLFVGIAVTIGWVVPQFVLLLIAWNRLDTCRPPGGWKHLARVIRPVRYLLVHLCLTLLAGWAAAVTVAILSVL